MTTKQAALLQKEIFSSESFAFTLFITSFTCLISSITVTIGINKFTLLLLKAIKIASICSLKSSVLLLRESRIPLFPKNGFSSFFKFTETLFSVIRVFAFSRRSVFRSARSSRPLSGFLSTEPIYPTCVQVHF